MPQYLITETVTRLVEADNENDALKMHLDSPCGGDVVERWMEQVVTQPDGMKEWVPVYPDEP